MQRKLFGRRTSICSKTKQHKTLLAEWMISNKQGTGYREIGSTNRHIVEDVAIIIDRSNQTQRSHNTCNGCIALENYARACEKERIPFCKRLDAISITMG
jgi:hypothetical protein